MVVLGVDPGLETVGYGVVRREGSRLVALDHGAIRTPRAAIGDRLRRIHEEVSSLLDRHRPGALATERQLFAANKTTALDVAKATGVVLLSAAERGLEAREYAPPEVKRAVVGHGGADKRQVQYMVAKLLRLSVPPRPDDAADALAIAIAHCLRAPIGIGVE